MGSGPAMLYDRQRALQRMVNSNENGADELNQLTARQPLPKIYLWAQVEGTALRVFVNELPDQQQPWWEVFLWWLYQKKTTIYKNTYGQTELVYI